MATHLCPSMLRHRDDALLHATLRPGPPGHHLPSVPTPGRHYDRRRYRYQQDGFCCPALLRPDARPQVGHKHGQLCQWRGLLSLQLQCCSRCRPYTACGYIHSWLPAYRRGSSLWHFSIAEEDEAAESDKDVVSQVRPWYCCHTVQSAAVRHLLATPCPKTSSLSRWLILEAFIVRLLESKIGWSNYHLYHLRRLFKGDATCLLTYL